MSKIYSKAPSGVAERVAHLVKVFHKDVHDAGVKIDVVSVADDDPDCEHALKVRGIPAYGSCRVISLKDRAKGNGDVEICIDEAKYLTLPDATKDAVLDHEIEHIELQVNKKGRVKLDACRRPKIKMRLHDVDLGWFASIAKRHGAAAIECKQATQIYLQHEQTFFAFVGEGRQAQLEERAGAAAQNFVRSTQAMIGKGGIDSMEVSSGGRGVKITKDGVEQL